MRTLLQDLKYGARMIRRQPTFSLVVILTLALAIGANTAVFALVNAVLLKPFPYPHPERVHLLSQAIRQDGPSQGSTAVDGRTWELVRDRAPSVNRAVFLNWSISVRRGRAFDVRDRAGSPCVVIVNDALVRAHFNGADPIERHIRLSGTVREIVGAVGDVQTRPGWGNNGPLAAMRCP